MKLPWDKTEKIQELEKEKKQLQQKIEELEDEKESYRERFEAEKERRSKLSAEKQKTEEEINKLQQKLENSSEETKETKEISNVEREEISLEEARRILEKFSTIQSPENDLITVYSPEDIGELADQQGLKGSVSKQNYNFMSEDSSFAAFMDEDFLGIKLKTRPFFKPEWKLKEEFDTSRISSFIEEEKEWAAVSAGETTIFQEKNGEILEKKEVSSRVDSKQKKGGFSQGRFERKRQEQIDEHVRMVEEKIGEDTFLVGEKSLCKKLPGTYLGGFNGDREFVDALYNFRLILK